MCVEILQCEYDLCDVEECNIVWENGFSSKESENFSALHILKGQINMGVAFKTLIPEESEIIELDDRISVDGGRTR